MMAVNPKLCIYCGNKGVTKEHIWGKWSRKHAPSTHPNFPHMVDRYLNFDLNGERSSRKGHLNRPGSTRSQTMKIACQACNNGWMKANVDAAIPILTRMNYGYWGKISSIETEALARWIAQFAMSFEFADRETVMIPQSVRSHFAETTRLAGHWIIAIGNAAPTDGSDPIYHRALGIMENGEITGPVQITAFMFGMLFCLAIYSSFPTPPELQRSIFDMKLCTIYPLSDKPIEKPYWRHSEVTVPIVVDAMSDAFSRWLENLYNV